MERGDQSTIIPRVTVIVTLIIASELQSCKQKKTAKKGINKDVLSIMTEYEI